jgi:hypothetical protein
MLRDLLLWDCSTHDILQLLDLELLGFDRPIAVGEQLSESTVLGGDVSVGHAPNYTRDGVTRTWPSSSLR